MPKSLGAEWASTFIGRVVYPMMNPFPPDRVLLALFVLVALIMPVRAETGMHSIYPSTTWGAWGDTNLWEGGVVPNEPGAVAEFTGETSEFHFIVYLSGRNVTVGQLLRTGTRGQMFINPQDVGPELAGSIELAGPEPLVECRTPLRIHAPVKGSAGLIKTGPAYLSLEKEGGTLEGDVIVREGHIAFQNPDCAGSIAITLEGNSAGLALGSGTFAWPLKLAAAQSFLLFAGPAKGQAELSGTISAPDRAPLVVTTRGNSGCVVLSGDNNFAGPITIGRADKDGPPIALRAASSTALGASGESVVFAADGSKTHDEDALELSGGITVEGKALTLRGRGAEAAGSLRSIGGENVWTGDIDLGALPAATIGVDQDCLVVQGAVTGEDPAVALVKAGAGTLELRGEASHAGGTVIKGGVLLAAHPRALAGRAVTVDATAGPAGLTLKGEQSVRVEGLTLQGPASLGFFPVKSNQPMLVVSAALEGTGTVDIEGDAPAPGSYLLLTAGGGRPGELSLGRMPAGASGQLQWQGNNLLLEVKAP
jgi:autotransporter-associated beta strand protein